MGEACQSRAREGQFSLAYAGSLSTKVLIFVKPEVETSAA